MKGWRFELERALRFQLRVRHKVKVEETEALPMFRDLTLAPRGLLAGPLFPGSSIEAP